MIVDVIQAYVTANVADILAPANGEFPSANLSGYMPLSTTWEGPSSLDPSGSIRTSQMVIRVFVATVGANTWSLNKDECERLHDEFVDLFDFTDADDAFIQQTAPPIRVTPGSVIIGQYYNVIEAPDGEPYHGFQVNLETTAHIDVSSC